MTLLPTMGPHSMLSVNPGNLRDRGPEEYYVSIPFELPPEARVSGIRWEAEVPARTWVKAQVRSTLTREDLSSAPWQGPEGGDGWFQNAGAVVGTKHEGQWIQYRLALGAVNGGTSPRITAVEVAYG